MNEEMLGRIRAGVISIARETIRRAVAAQPQSVAYSQGCHNAIVRDIPDLIGDAAARAAVAERSLDNALAKIVTLQMQLANVQDRLAALEAKQPAKFTDAGNVVPFELGSVRHIASA